MGWDDDKDSDSSSSPRQFGFDKLEINVLPALIWIVML